MLQTQSVWKTVQVEQYGQTLCLVVHITHDHFRSPELGPVISLCSSLSCLGRFNCITKNSDSSLRLRPHSL